MAIFTIGTAAKREELAPGTYTAVFEGIEPFTRKSDQAELYRWKFRVGELTCNSITGRTSPTTTNALGRNLCALSKSPLVAGVDIDPEHYIGRGYLIVVKEKENGTYVDTFTQL